jgi:hypothetical protein
VGALSPERSTESSRIDALFEGILRTAMLPFVLLMAGAVAVALWVMTFVLSARAVDNSLHEWQFLRAQDPDVRLSVLVCVLRTCWVFLRGFDRRCSLTVVVRAGNAMFGVPQLVSAQIPERIMYPLGRDADGTMVILLRMLYVLILGPVWLAGWVVHLFCALGFALTGIGLATLLHLERRLMSLFESRLPSNFLDENVRCEWDDSAMRRWFSKSAAVDVTADYVLPPTRMFTRMAEFVSKHSRDHHEGMDLCPLSTCGERWRAIRERPRPVDTARERSVGLVEMSEDADDIRDWLDAWHGAIINSKPESRHAVEDMLMEWLETQRDAREAKKSGLSPPVKHRGGVAAPVLKHKSSNLRRPTTTRAIGKNAWL